MLNRMTGKLAVALVAAMGFAGQVNADSIGVKYERTSTLEPTDVAGAPGFEQANWNMATASQGQGPPATPINGLIDSNGNVTTVNISSWTQTSNNSWTLDDSVSSNAILINDFSDQRPSITFEGLGSAFTTSGYSVVVYYANNEGPSTSTLTLTGSVDDLVSRDIRTGNTSLTSYSAVGFVQEFGLEPPTQSTNYTVFSGLNDAGFTVALTGENNNGIAAIQIVSEGVIPEPASIALLGLGGLLVLRRRR